MIRNTQFYKLCSASRNLKSKMSPYKPEMIISKHVYNVITEFCGNTHVCKSEEFNEAILYIVYDASQVRNSRFRLTNMNISCLWVVILNFCRLLASLRYSSQNFATVMYTCCDISISRLWTTISDCWCYPALHSMENRSADFPDLKIHVYSLRHWGCIRAVI